MVTQGRRILFAGGPLSETHHHVSTADGALPDRWYVLEERTLTGAEATRPPRGSRLAPGREHIRHSYRLAYDEPTGQHVYLHDSKEPW